MFNNLDLFNALSLSPSLFLSLFLSYFY